MIRKAIIVVLTLASSVAVTLGVGSYSVGAYLGRKPTRHSYVLMEASRGWLCIQILEWREAKSSDTSIFDGYEAQQRLCELDSLNEYALAWYGDPIWGRGGTAIAGTSQTRQFLNLLAASFFLGVYPAIAFCRGPLRRWRRRRWGMCLRCGYDLTGNESGVCPECGGDIATDV